MILTIIALLISIGGTIISYFTYRTQRLHNIKSVKPIIHIGQWDYENNLHVTLQNVGPGLAVVSKMAVSNAYGESKSNLYAWLPPILKDGVNYKEYWTPYQSFVVQPGQVIKLVEIPLDSSNPRQVTVRDRLRAIIGQLIVKVEYTDIYDTVMPIKEMALTHFLRNDNINAN